MKSSENNNKEWIQYVGLATQWMVMLALALWLGMFLDKKISASSHLLTVLLPLAALSISLYQLIKKFTQPKK